MTGLMSIFSILDTGKIRTKLAFTYYTDYLDGPARDEQRWSMTEQFLLKCGRRTITAEEWNGDPPKAQFSSWSPSKPTTYPHKDTYNKEIIMKTQTRLCQRH